MSARVKVYTQTYCPYCLRAKNLLQRKGIAFEEINLDGKDQELAELKKRTNLLTIPQIFIDDQLVGGFQELAALEASGDLDKMLSA